MPGLNLSVSSARTLELGNRPLRYQVVTSQRLQRRAGIDGYAEFVLVSYLRSGTGPEVRFKPLAIMTDTPFEADTRIMAAWLN